MRDPLANPLPAWTWYAARAELMRVSGLGPEDFVIIEVDEPTPTTILPPPLPPEEAASGIYETIDFRGPPLPRIEAPSSVELAAHAVVDLGARAMRRLLNGGGRR